MTERKKKRREHTSAPREYREELKPKTSGHAEYIRCIAENTVTFCTGPAGCSKSYTALGMASQYVLSGDMDKIIIIRPAVEASPRGLGYIPGSIENKLQPYVMPALQHLMRFLGQNTYYALKNSGKIQFEALEYIRGRTFDDSIVVCEEFQDATKEQIIMAVTRLGQNSKMIINGDMAQTDIPRLNSEFSTDLEYVIHKIQKNDLKHFGIVELCDADIVRSGIIAPFLKIFEK